MKIDKVLFSCSVDYAPFWEIQSRVWKECLGIEPVCLFFGDKVTSGMSENYGQVIERKYLPELPKVLQVVWSKFDHPITEPDTTWILGDIDMIPLQRDHFIKKIELFPSWTYAHLNAEGISKEFGGDFPAHYHVSKGRNFEMFTQGQPFEQQVKQILVARKYGQGARNKWPDARRHKDETDFFWLAEEHRSSEIIWAAIKEARIDFRTLTYNNQHGTDRIDRTGWDGGIYILQPERVYANEYVDIHCHRPFCEQVDDLRRIIGSSWQLSL